MKLYNIAMADYNKMAMNIGFIVLVIYILIKAITAIFDFYGISPVSYISYILFFVALGIFGGILPSIRGGIFHN
tara:strand:+ start:124 stop:345 length:222 start_codon:yes stop_codon:yes gene_type:complete